jgi:hypothetical protein
MDDFDLLVDSDREDNEHDISACGSLELVQPPGGLRIDDAIPGDWPVLVSDLVKLSTKGEQGKTILAETAGSAGISGFADRWTGRMIRFLDEMAQGMTIKGCLDEKLTTAVELMSWRLDALFSACLTTLKEAETLAAEAMTWDKALKDPNASIERMFAIKSRRPEYKDNAPPAGPGQINIQVNVAGKTFDVSANRTDDD